MKNFHSICHFLSTLLLKSHKKQDITVNQLCKTSGVSTRTYSKLVKHILVKPDCYVRLVIGFCKNVLHQFGIRACTDTRGFTKLIDSNILLFA